MVWHPSYHWWTASIKPRLVFSRAGYASWGLSFHQFNDIKHFIHRSPADKSRQVFRKYIWTNYLLFYNNRQTAFTIVTIDTMVTVVLSNPPNVFRYYNNTRVCICLSHVQYFIWTLLLADVTSTMLIFYRQTKITSSAHKSLQTSGPKCLHDLYLCCNYFLLDLL